MRLSGAGVTEERKEHASLGARLSTSLIIACQAFSDHIETVVGSEGAMWCDTALQFRKNVRRGTPGGSAQRSVVSVAQSSAVSGKVTDTTYLSQHEQAYTQRIDGNDVVDSMKTASLDLIRTSQHPPQL